MAYEDYKKREFCNDVRCPVQMEMNKHSSESEGYNALRGICSSSCLKSANEFLRWLQDHGFILVKEDDFSVILPEEETKTLAKSDPTTWLFHRALTKKGFTIVKKIDE